MPANATTTPRRRHHRRANPRLYAMAKYGNVPVLISRASFPSTGFYMRFECDHLHRKTINAMQTLPAGVSRADLMRDGIFIPAANKLPPMRAEQAHELLTGGRATTCISFDPWAVAHYYGGDAHLVFERDDC